MTEEWQLQNPQLTFRADGAPVARRYGDIYHNADGLAETRHVYLGGIGAPAVWGRSGAFVLGEIGFGTGLNFLATWAAWRDSAPAGARLHYVAVENAPLPAATIAEIHVRHPALAGLVAELCQQVLDPAPGFHRFWLDKGRVCLTLLLGEAAAALAAVEAVVDAWYLDGFAPARNADAWRPAVLAEVARLSRPGARLASFTAAGQVRGDLAKVGFEVVKSPGFGTKREMITGRFAGPPRPVGGAPWYRLPRAPDRPGRVVIIGAGVAGAALAAALGRRQVYPLVIDAAATVGAGASSVPLGLVTPPLNPGRNPSEAFKIAAFRYQYAALPAAIQVQIGGLWFTPKDTRAAARFADLVVTEGPARGLFSDAAPGAPGAYFCAQAGGLAPGEVIDHWLAASAVVLGRRVVDAAPMAGGWRLALDDGAAIDAETVIWANAGAIGQWPAADFLPVHGVRGQLSAVPASIWTGGAADQGMVGAGYVTPARAGLRYLGATFDHIAWSTPAASAVRAEDHARVVEKAPVDGLTPGAVVDGWAGIRCFSGDRAPIAGPVPEQGAFLKTFARLRHGRRGGPYGPSPLLPGMYALTGFGARGLTAAPLAAELVASQIMGEPWPTPRDQAEAMMPARFLVRRLQRGAS